MKKYIVVLGILTLAACSNHQNDVVGVDTGGEKYAMDQVNQERLACKKAQKSSKSPFEVKRMY
jgi:hypothetical protein